MYESDMTERAHTHTHTHTPFPLLCQQEMTVRFKGIDLQVAMRIHLFTFMHWRRIWQPTPVFLPGESQGWRSLVGCRLWGRTESDTAEVS